MTFVITSTRVSQRPQYAFTYYHRRSQNKLRGEIFFVISAKPRTIRRAQWNQSLAFLILNSQIGTQGHKGRAQSSYLLLNPFRQPGQQKWVPETRPPPYLQGQRRCSISCACMPLLTRSAGTGTVQLELLTQNREGRWGSSSHTGFSYPGDYFKWILLTSLARG